MRAAAAAAAATRKCLRYFGGESLQIKGPTPTDMYALMDNPSKDDRPTDGG